MDVFLLCGECTSERDEGKRKLLESLVANGQEESFLAFRTNECILRGYARKYQG